MTLDEGRPRSAAAEQASPFDQLAARELPPPVFVSAEVERPGLGDLKPYPARKHSGVRWLGNVPEHWDVVPNRAIFVEVKERDHPEEQMLSVTITNGVIRQQALLADSSKKDSSNQDKSAYKLVKPGDIAYNKMRAWQGAVGVSEYRGIVSPAYVVQRPRARANSRYLHYLLRTPAFAKEAERWSYGITSDMWSLRPEHFKMIYGCFPPLPEQAAIVRFLSHAVRRIRRYIRAKQKLIKLLEEQKQAIVHRAVTGGLNPNVRLKPSGVEWLGNVPEHWEVRRLGRMAKVFNGTTPSRMEPAYWLGGTVPWLSSGKVNDYIVEAASELVTERALHECSIQIVSKGAVIIGLVGQGKTRAKSAILGIDACINQNLAAVIPLHGLTGTYLLHFLTAFYPTFREFGRGGNQEALNCEIVANWRISIPPEDEQEAICEYLRSALAGLREADKRIGRELDLLHEYRTRLITDVVTGKLDVREAVARLPDEAEELEQLDEAESGAGVEENAVDDLGDVPEEAEA
jgi:type I restriction enzyme S subunit